MMASMSRLVLQVMFGSWSLLIFTSVVNSQQSQENDELVQQAADTLIQHYATSLTGNGMTSKDFATFLQDVTQHSEQYVENAFTRDECDEGGNINCSRNIECPGLSHVFERFATSHLLEANGLVKALPMALGKLTLPNCTSMVDKGILHLANKKKPTMGEAWGYGIGFVTAVVIISNIGICLGPFMNRPWYKGLLQFLVAMGAGSLASTGLLVLIPEAFDIMSVEELASKYVWKSTVAILSIYVFYSCERILKTFLYRKNVAKKNSNSTTARDTLFPLTDSGRENNQHGHSHLPPGLAEGNESGSNTLAWMVMAGDIIHNFVDGLSMGAAFTENLALGISVSLAVLSEELPHELADIAILLHSGLSIKKSLLINFLSACVCYIGLILGIMMASLVTEASKWIFAIAGGLFLYVPLVDMLPSMSAHLDEAMAAGGYEAKQVALLHSCGLVLGAGIIIFIVNITPYIAV